MQYKNLGLYIKKKRLEKGVSLNNFAFDNAIEPAILSRIENLKQGIKIEVLAKIARGFDMSLSEFLREFEKNFCL